MPLVEYPEFADVDAALVSENVDEVVARLKEQYPGLDFDATVIREILAEPHALLEAGLETVVASYEDNLATSDVLANPDAVPDWALQEVLTRWNIERNPATTARGVVAIARDTGATLTLPLGFRFSGQGQTFVTENVYSIKNDESLINGETDVLATQSGSRWTATIPVVAEVAGAEGQLKRGTPLTPENTLDGFITAYAWADFAGGADADDGPALKAKLEAAMSAPCLAGEANMKAWLAREFPSVPASSVVGFGFAEQIRDKHWIWGSGGGGRVDWYVRSQYEYQDVKVTLTGTLTEKLTDGGGAWTLPVTRDAAPGYYLVVSALPEGSTDAGSLEILSEERSWDSSADEMPDIADALEAIYSPYQTAVLVVKNTEDTAALTVGDTASFDVVFRLFPLLKSVQDAVEADATRPAAADVLVKAPVPCFATVSLSVLVPPGEDADEEALQQAISDVVNRAGFDGRLHVSRLYQAAEGVLAGTGAVTFLEARGRIRRPDGTYVSVSDRDLLLIPDEPDRLVSRHTAQFLCTPADVAVTITQGS